MSEHLSAEIRAVARTLGIQDAQREPLLRLADKVEVLEKAALEADARSVIRMFLLRLQNVATVQRLLTARDVLEQAFNMLGAEDESEQLALRRKIRRAWMSGRS